MSGVAGAKESAFPYRLYLVVSADGCAGRDFVEVTERAIEGGVDVVQLREKGVPDELFLERALRLKEMLDRRGVPLVINDNVDVARRCGAWGVHVGVNDMSPVRVRELWPECGSIGLSIESLRQLGVTENGVTGCYDAAGNNLIVNDLTGNVEGARAADCLAVSPVFATPSKTDTVTEWGLDGVARIRTLTGKPLVAIGGLGVSNAAEVVRAGADCIAVISAICSAADPARAAAEIRGAVEGAL